MCKDCKQKNNLRKYTAICDTECGWKNKGYCDRMIGFCTSHTLTTEHKKEVEQYINIKNMQS